MNLYAYAGGNPVSFSDPWGLNPCLRSLVACVQGFAAGVAVIGRGVAAAGRWIGQNGQRVWSSAREVFSNPAVQQSLDDVVNVADDVGARVQSSSAGAYEVAVAGGRHAGLIANSVGRTTAQIQRGISSLEGRVAEHLDKIANPTKYVPDWTKLDPRAQQGALRFWEAEAASYAQQAEVLRGVLANR